MSSAQGDHPRCLVRQSDRADPGRPRNGKAGVLVRHIEAYSDRDESADTRCAPCRAGLEESGPSEVCARDSVLRSRST